MVLKEKLNQKNLAHKRRGVWKRAVSALACLVVFCTTYALVLPAITASAQAYCGAEEHTHTDECYGPVLTCGLEEQAAQIIHEHTEDCYDNEGNVVCGYEQDQLVDNPNAHTHTDICYSQQLVCGKEEHVHSTQCYSNPDADVESESDWTYTLSGTLNEDVAAVAKAQLGYAESTANYAVAEDGVTLNGYTRYGAWSGDAYAADWNTLFAAFCLHYGGADGQVAVSTESAAAWLDALNAAGESSPELGALVFIDKNNDGTADQVGIITALNGETGFTAVVGDENGAVAAKQLTADGVLAIVPLTEAEKNQASEAKAAGLDFEDEAEADSAESSGEGIMLLADDSNASAASGIDMTNYITGVTFQKKNGLVWETSTSFSTLDQVRGSIAFENVAVSTLQANSNTLYVDLPSGIDCSRFTGVYDTYDGNTHSGKYHYEKKADGSYRIVLVLDDEYVKNAGDVIGGSLRFEFYWDSDKVPTDGKVPWKIGNEEGTVNIKNDGSSKKEDTSANYSISKTADGITYSEDGKTIYITYHVTLGVKQSGFASVTLKDILEGDGFTYDTSYGIQTDSSSIKANFGSTYGQESGTQIQVWPVNTSDGNIPVGTYTLTYRVKSTATDVSEAENLAQSVHNKIQVPEDGDNTISSETWTRTTTATINKSGQVSGNGKDTVIDYTVYLNAGAIVKNLKQESTFTDTLPDNLKLDGDVTITQYDVTGKVINTFKANVDGNTISYTIPTGQYYYIVTYRTKLKDEVTIPTGGLTIENTADSKGGIDGSSTDKQTIKNDNLKKNFVSQNLAKDDNGTWYDTIKWTSTINVSGSLDGYVYEDYGGAMQDPSSTAGYWFAPISMSDAQRSAIVVKDSSGKVIDRSLYTVEASDHVDSQRYTDANKTPVKNGLFKITFDKSVSGPVTLEYETTVDMSQLTLNGYYVFYNYAELTKDGSTARAQAQTNTIQYVQDVKKIIHKYGASYYADSNSQTTKLEPGQTSIAWTIGVNEGQSLYEDITVTDTIPEDLTFDSSTFIVRLNALNGQEITDSDDISWNFDKSTRTLTVNIKAAAYSSTQEGDKHSQAVVISFRTNLPEDFIKGNEESKSFSNTATATINGQATDSTFTQDVKRQVVGKSGTYDETNKLLTYQINVNPDAATLNGGKDITVQDVLKLGTKASGILENMELTGVQVFTAVKTESKDGKVTIQPGSLVAELTAVDTATGNQGEYLSGTTTGSDGAVESLDFTTWLSDSTAYVILATYQVNFDPTADIALVNSVILSGSKDWSGQDSSTKITKDTSGETHTNKDEIILTKRDKSLYSKVLSGAMFKLEQYDSTSGAWIDFKSTESTGSIAASQSTNASGQIIWQGVSYGTLYRITETGAPEGYVLDSTPTYLVIARTADAANAKDNLPDSISGDTSYSKDAVKVGTVKDNETGKTYYADVKIDRYDTKDTTKVEKGQLRVTKQWIGSDQQEITDPTELAKMSDVTVTLTKHSPETVKVTFVGMNNTRFNKTVPKGSTIISVWTSKGTWSVSDEAAVQIDTSSGIVFRNITADVTLTNTDMYLVDGMYSDTFGGSLTVDTSGASTDKVDTTIGIITLNSSNDWTYLWSDLDTSDGVTYTLTETAVDGYTTTYTINGSDLADGTALTPSASGDIITVTNTAKPTYSLPKTGGVGLIPVYSSGLLILAGCLLYGLHRRRTGKERYFR